MRFSFRSDLSHQLNDKLGEVDNFQAWKYRISLVLEENELDTYLSERFQFQREMRLKSLHKKKFVKTKKIITNSIKDHLIPQVSS